MMHTYCDICDRDIPATLWHQDGELADLGICDECWIDSAQTGGVHAETPLTLTSDGTDPQTLTLGDFMADNDGVLSVAEIIILIGLPVGESLTLGGGASPLFSLTRS